MPYVPTRKRFSKSVWKIITKQKSMMRRTLALIAVGALLSPMLSLTALSRNLTSPINKASRASSAGKVANTSASPLVPMITATKTDALLVDNDSDNNADTGDTLKYTVTITNNGSTDATGVMFNDTLDPNTTLVPGSITTTPIAVNDTYAASGNIQISINAANGVLANDSDPDGNTLTASAGATSANGGNVTMNADGSFTYNPPPGFEGTDTFTYSITDGTTPDTATVTINVSGMIWFVDNTAAAGGDGRLTSPYNCLVGAGCFDPSAPDGPGDNIFLYSGSGSYNGGLTLLANQKLIGQGAGNTLAAIVGFTPPAGSSALPATGGTSPLIVSGTNGVNLGTNNVLRGFDIGNTGGTDIFGNSFGLLTVREVNLSGTGQALNLSTGTLNALFGSVASNNSSSTGISLISVGGTLVSGPTSIQNPSAAGISVSIATASLNFGNTTVNGSGGTGVFLQSNTGNIAFGDLSILPDAGQRAFLANLNSAGTISSTSGGISSSGVPAVEVNGTNALNRTNLNMTLTSVSASAGTNGLVLNNTSGGFSVTGDGSNTANGSGGTISGMLADGILLTNATNVSLTGMNIQNNQNNGISGTEVDGFVLDDSNVTNNTNAVGEAGLRFSNLTGTLIAGTNPTRIENTTVSGSTEHNVVILNTSGTLADLLVKNSTFKDPSVALGADGFNIETRNNASATLRLEGNTFQNNPTQGFQGVAIDNSFLKVTATAGNTFNANGEGIVLSNNATADVTFNIDGNTFTNHSLNGIAVVTGSGATASALYTGKVTNNTINGVVGGDGVVAIISGNATGVLEVSNNTISNIGTRGIFVTVGEVAAHTATLESTITGNNISAVGVNGILVQSRFGTNLCSQISGNTSTAGGSTAIRVRQRDASTFRLPGFLGPFNSTVAVDAFVQANNPGAASVSSTITTAFSGGAACASPVVMRQAAPAQRQYFARETSKAAQRKAATVSRTSKSKSDSQLSAMKAHADSQAKNANAKSSTAPRIKSMPLSSSVNLNIGTLPAGKSITITFNATINNSVPPGTTQVSNQGTVSGSNFANVLTDDPDVGGAADPTVTPIQAQTPPDITCPAPITEAAPSGSCSKSVSFNVTATGSPAPTVDCKIGSTSITSPHTFPVGTTTVTCTASNGVPPDDSCSFTVTITDPDAPVITVNGDNPMTVECGTTFTDPGATANDLCAGPVTVNASGTVDANNPGTYTITYTATDGTNTATATRTVYVVDTTAPVITVNGANPMTVECGTTFTDPGATATDSCEGTVPVNSSGTVDTSTPGTYTITYTATDGTNTATATRTVNVVDTTAPVITVNAPNPMTVECHTSFTDPGATATDSCQGTVAVTSTNNVNVNVPGSYTVNYSATDSAGNTATATRTVNVVDTIAPTLTLNGANPMTVECHTSFTDPGATASDSCAGDLTGSIVVTGSVNPNVVGTYTLTYTVSDGYNSASASRTVNVVDTIAPVITVNGANPMIVECHTTFTDPGATATDSCAGNVPVSSSSNVNPNVPGTYTITYTATDGYNTSNATRTVIVVDTGLPVINLNGQSVTLWPPNHQYVTVNLTQFVVSASDGCDGTIDINDVVIFKVTSDEPENGGGDGNTLNDIVIAANCKSVQLRSERQGSGNGRVYTIHFRVTDAQGNVATATAKVKVPKSQGNNGGAVEDAPQYTETCP